MSKTFLVSLMVVAMAGLTMLSADASLPFGKKNSTAAAANPIVEMDTSKGTIKIEVFAEEVPKTAANFLDLVNRGFYNGLTFHRYEPGFCVQGGDPNGNGSGGFIDPKTGSERTIPLEVNPSHKHNQAGMVAMARSGNPDSASSQFYFTLGPCSHLDGLGYSIFGKVTEGLNVVRELRIGDKMTKVFVLTQPKK